MDVCVFFCCWSLVKDVFIFYSCCIMQRRPYVAFSCCSHVEDVLRVVRFAASDEQSWSDVLHLSKLLPLGSAASVKKNTRGMGSFYGSSSKLKRAPVHSHKVANHQCSYHELTSHIRLPNHQCSHHELTLFHFMNRRAVILPDWRPFPCKPCKRNHQYSKSQKGYPMQRI
jgi:hypothetical protein